MDIVAQHNEAVALMRDARWEDAVPLLVSVLNQNSDYEHGAPWYDLACCRDELGEEKETLCCYERALDYDQTSDVFLGGLASHLYRHGSPKDALDMFTRYLDVVGENSELGEKARPAIEALKRKIVKSKGHTK